MALAWGQWPEPYSNLIPSCVLGALMIKLIQHHMDVANHD